MVPFTTRRYRQAVGRTALTIGVLGLVGCGTRSSPLPANPAPLSTTPSPEAVGLPPQVAIAYPVRFSARYAFLRHDSTIITGFAGGAQTQTSDLTVFVQVDADPSGAGLRVVLDSIVQLLGDTAELARRVDALGTVWQAPWTSSGLAGELSQNRKSSIGDQLTQNIWLLFPLLPQSGLVSGTTWSDTASYPHAVAAFQVLDSVRTNYRSLVGANGGVRVDGEAVFTRNGSGTQGGQLLEVGGIGLRSSIYNLSGDGLPSSGTITDSLSLTIQIPSGGAVPVRQIGRLQFRRVP